MARTAWAMARGRGTVPDLNSGLPATTFEVLERPLGHLEEAVQHPFLQFFMAQAASAQYAIASRPGWPIIASFRALALSYPVGQWFMRWFATDSAPSPEHAIDIITMLDRGQGFAPLASVQHRTRVTTLAKLNELERLVVWYAR
jgi:hypothetical protein